MDSRTGAAQFTLDCSRIVVLTPSLLPRSIATTSGLAILFAGVNLSQNLPMQVVTFVFYSFFRTFLFSLMFAYLAR